MSLKRLRGRLPVRGSAANRATTTMIDQGVASASNFFAGIVVARISGPAGLGAFALAFTVWVLLTMQYRAMVTEPMVILGDMRRDDSHEIVRHGVAGVATFGLAAGCLVAAVGTACLTLGQHTFGVGLLAYAAKYAEAVCDQYLGGTPANAGGRSGNDDALHVPLHDQAARQAQIAACLSHRND